MFVCVDTVESQCCANITDVNGAFDNAFPTIRPSSSSELNSAVHRQSLSSCPLFRKQQSISTIPAEQTSSSSVWVSDQSARVPSRFSVLAVCFPFMHTHTQQSALKRLKGGGGEGSVPLIKVSSLWVVTQPDRGSTPDLLMRALRRGRHSLSLSVGRRGGFLSEA